MVANLVYLLHDPRWLKALGDVVTTAVGLVAVLRMWAVFPFDFGDSSFDLVDHGTRAAGRRGGGQRHRDRRERRDVLPHRRETGPGHEVTWTVVFFFAAIQRIEPCSKSARSPRLTA